MNNTSPFAMQTNTQSTMQEELYEVEEVKELSDIFNIDKGGLKSGTIYTPEMEPTNKEEPSPFVQVDNFNIDDSLEKEFYDDYSTIRETDIKYPYLVFEARGSVATLIPLCKSLLEPGDTQLYFRPDGTDLGVLLPIATVSTTPKNIRSLLRISAKDSARYCKDANAPEIPVSPEQFIRFIKIPLKEDETYWQELLSQEQTPTQEMVSLDDIFGE